ncbi:MAG: hypothetical protein COU29_00125 [Candidatus Magasanikbacteria bacterium CG10_big_fil_rev_8_21_14_0_10_36_32]|uniref:Glycosyltransferase n=1 Tax=Candidatus Magasanikbacteria bacterium CG10_big_fil_rev_8_21_14_0_10_36_32 TaxID=1974646 RepID=A0A2M6W7R0_9BACT|nr:MAG: hypothetical protein COU29_00125 [Candidatus Magasanikbacteria bacterium CG10_big_fil_rev_8_21_14_0_10_36_32]
MPVVLNVRVDNLSLTEAREKARGFLHSSSSHTIFTPNPEMIVKAQADQYFKDVLNKGSLNLCDGFGLHIVSGARRIAGVDFMMEICQISAEENKSIFLLGSSSDDIAKKTAEELKTINPSLRIVGHFRGPDINENIKISKQKNCDKRLIVDETENEIIIQQINESGAKVVFVAFGMGKQEKWIMENLSKMPQIKIAMGVGGSFDYISGTVKRAPCWMRRIGLEWGYRFLTQPKRVGRIFNATIRFIFLVLENNFKF